MHVGGWQLQRKREEPTQCSGSLCGSLPCMLHLKSPLPAQTPARMLPTDATHPIPPCLASPCQGAPPCSLVWLTLVPFTHPPISSPKLPPPPPCSLVWLILLPFTLWAAYSWFSILLSGIFAFLMFGIDEIGVQIEEPFGWVFLSCSVLPLEAICSVIERSIQQQHYRPTHHLALRAPLPLQRAAAGGHLQ